MNINTKAASKIKELRLKNNITSEAMAKDLGLSKSAYSQLENGKVEITLNKIEAVAHVLSVPVQELIPVTTKNYLVSNGSGDNYNESTVTNHHYILSQEEKLKELIATFQTSLEEIKTMGA